MRDYDVLMRQVQSLWERAGMPSLDLTPKVSAESRAFHAALKDLSGLCPVDRDPSATPTVLNVACGTCREGLALHSFMSGAPLGTVTQNVRILGIDNDPQEIETAASNYKNVPGFQFVCGDGRRLAEYFPGMLPVDLALIRHQFSVSDGNTWFELFAHTALALKPGASMIITSLSVPEHAVALKLLEHANVPVKAVYENPHGREMRKKTPDKSRLAVDGYIIVAGGGVAKSPSPDS